MADYIERERVERGWSFGEIVRRSGDYIKSPSTLVNVVNGNVGEVSENTMRGVAKAFNVPLKQVFDIYYGTGESVDLETLSKPPVEFRQLPDGDLLIRITPPSTGDLNSTDTSGLQTQGEKGDEKARQRRRELLVWMFDDIPDECQLDVLASVAGVHTRRSLSARIHQRHEARATARNIIDEKFNERESTRPGQGKRHPAVTDTPPDVPLPETTPEDLGEEEEGENRRNGRANGTNGTDDQG